jgi:prephenate dehydrogenase
MTVERPEGFTRIAVVGLGAMGGSLAKALGTLPDPPRRIGWSVERPEARSALSERAVDAAPERLQDAVEEADLVVLAVPLSAVIQLMAEIATWIAPDALVTDVASLKAPVARAAAAAGLRDRWVGSHPMCGSEDSGFAASRSDLYRGARIFLVSHPDAETPHARLASFWRALGAEPERVAAAEHDVRMALVSHLPQLTANALAAAFATGGILPEELGPGGADMTRLAGSSPQMWSDVLAAGTTVSTHLRALARELDAIARHLDDRELDEVAALMRRTRKWRREA